MPNAQKILVVLVDQLRADCVEGALAQHANLPNIQAFRHEGVTFTNHFSNASPCGPSRASLLTGRYVMNHRSMRNGTPLAAGIPNIASELRKSGYDPMLFGYTDTALDPNMHHPSDPVLATEESVLPGFREVLEMRYMESYPWRAYLTSKGYDLPDFAHFYRPVPSDPNQPAALDDPAFYRAEHSDTAFLTDELIKNLSVRTHQNWMAMATFIRPHPPLVAPEPFNKIVDPNSLPMPSRMESAEQERAVHPYVNGVMETVTMETITRGFKGRINPRDDKAMQTLRAIYLGLAQELDQHFGRIIQFLKDSGQYDNTIVVFTADHGEMLGDHHQWGKETFYDQSFRVPLIIRDPAHHRQFGQNVSALTQSVDFMPTLLDLRDQACPSGVDGASLKPFLAGETPENWRDHVHLELDYSEPDQPTKRQLATGTSQRDSNFVILRETRFKLVHFNGGLPALLFDLENDPFEMQNLADDPAYSATLLRLTQKLLSHRMRHADQTFSNIKIGASGAWGFGG